MKKVIVFMIILFLGFIGCILFFDNSEIDNDGGNQQDNQQNNNVKEIWSNNTEIKLNNIYNYDKDEMEAGTLTIKDGKVVFLDLQNNILKDYSYINENILVIDKLYDTYNEKNMYLLLSENGNLFICDNDDFMSDEPFYKFESNDKIKKIKIRENNDNEIIVDALNFSDEKIEIKIIK